MTIGIAIPTFKGHVEHLPKLLDSIARSTIPPTEVSISISECGEKRNTAQNTNTACAALTTDIISTIGGDDLVHPQRCEFLLAAFENTDTDIVVHNYQLAKEIDEEFLKSRYTTCELYVNYIDTIVNNILNPVSKFTQYDFANGFVSFRRAVFKKFKYNTAPEWEYKEDSLFNRTLVENGYKISYIKNKLALYLKNPNRK